MSAVLERSAALAAPRRKPAQRPLEALQDACERGPFGVYRVPSDYMRPVFEPGDVIEIDTSVTQFERDGYYLLHFPMSAPHIRRLDADMRGGLIISDGRGHLERCSKADVPTVQIIGRAVRRMRIDRI